MKHGNGSLTGAEWTVMECLWEHSPRTGREVALWLNEKMGWSRSTSLTLLRRLEAKGAVASEEGEPKTFRPLIARDEESPKGSCSFSSGHFGLQALFSDMQG